MIGLPKTKLLVSLHVLTVFSFDILRFEFLEHFSF